MRHLALSLLAACCFQGLAMAYSIAVTRAIEAPTIAEIFITEQGVRAELEIGDQPADEVWKRLTVRAGGRFLKQRIVSRYERLRAQRDPLTGELLPASADAEQVVVAVVEYPFSGKPARLTFAGPRIGFVAYHLGLPVTDLHYLSGEQTVELDWRDPWNSRFTDRRLWRSRDAKITVFLYVEAYEVRVEVVARAVDIGPETVSGKFLAKEHRAEIAQQAGEKAARRFRLLVDGSEVQAQFDRAHFLRRRLWSSTVVADTEDLLASTATLGLIYAHPLKGYPEEVVLEWDMVGFERVAGMVTDEAASRPEMLTEGENVLRWENLLKGARPAAMVDLRGAPGEGAWLWTPAFAVSVGMLLLVLANVARAWYRTRPVSRVALVAGFLLLITAGVSFRGMHSTSLLEPEARKVVRGLLWNIYRAFDVRDENTVYDLLARSVDGDLLEKTYLETRAALELRRQGGARVRVTQVEVEDMTLSESGSGLIVAKCTWRVGGSVGHWGHLHQRQNRYQAQLSIGARQGQWKITRLDLELEERI